MGIHYTKRFAEENSIIFINSNRLKVNLCARGPDMQISRDRAIETELSSARFWFLIAFHRATVFGGAECANCVSGFQNFFSLGCVSVGSRRRRKETFVFILIKKWNLIKKPVLLLLLLHEYLVNFECCLDQDLWVKSRALTSRHARLNFWNPFGARIAKLVMEISIASFIKVKWKNETQTGLMKLLALLNRKKFQFFRLSKKKKRKKWKQGNDRAA